MKKAALAVAAAIVAAATIFSSLQIYSISQRVAVLERAQAASRDTVSVPVLPTSRPAPRVEPPDGSLHMIESIVDGDTVNIRFQGETISMRIIGIDTPETVHPSRPVEPYGPEATVRARELLEGKTVTLEYDADPEHDRFGSAFIRQRAASSMRKRKKASQPGQPPSRHFGGRCEGLGKILFYYDPRKESGVVGPVRFHTK